MDITKQSIEFFLLSYFKIKFDSNFDTILPQVKNKAYNDATMRGAYSGSDNKASLDNQSILNLINCRSNEEFNNLHEKTCNKMVETEEFSYGNAQKYVNMTLKYLLIISRAFGLFEINFSELKNIDTSYKFFHIPVDRYILESAWNLENKNLKKEDKKIKFPYKDDYCKTKCGSFSADKITAWSKWETYKVYRDFRESLDNYIKSNNELNEKYLCPIEWEFDAFVNADRD